MSPIRVLIVDDHPLLREGITAAISRDPRLEVLGPADNGEEAAALAAAAHPDVVVISGRMPKTDGLQAMREIHAHAPGIHVLILTDLPDDEVILTAARDGAAGILLHDVAPQELVAAICVVAAGQCALHPQVARVLVDAYRAVGSETPSNRPDA